VRYLAAVKTRPRGASAAAFCNGAWSVIITREALWKWFGIETTPDQGETLYAVLGVPRTATPQEIKRAHRALARQWHPDVCKEPDAENIFVKIQQAYEMLSDPTKRQKYDAGLLFCAQGKMPQYRQASLLDDPYYWRPPRRNGYILSNGEQSGKWFVVHEILGWEDIVNERGQVLVSSWPKEGKMHEERWVEP
jgi:hypothetical protein